MKASGREGSGKGEIRNNKTAEMEKKGGKREKINRGTIDTGKKA